jgi:hypothetical protein
MSPRKALFGLNFHLAFGIHRVFLHFAGKFILENHLSSVRGKFQTGIFVHIKALDRRYTSVLQGKVTQIGAKIPL